MGVGFEALIRERFRRGEYVQARRIAEGVLALEGSSDEERCAAALWAAEAAYQLDDAQATIALSRRAIFLAESTGDDERCGRAWFRLLGAQIMAGDHGEALEAGNQFLAGLDHQWPELDAELGAKAICNIAMLHRNAKRLPEALQAYWQALVRFQRSRHVEGEIVCRQQTAWLLTTMGDLDQADEHLQFAGVLISPDVPVYLHVHQLTNEAFLRLHQGRHTEAVELCEEVLVPGRQGVTEANRAVAFYVTGMAAHQIGQTSTARAMLNLAQDAAVKSGLAAIMNLVQELARAVRAGETSR